MREVNGVIINSIDAVKIAHHKINAASLWFSKETLRWWSCFVNSAVYSGRYFVTSEETYDGSRAYSIRELSDAGFIDTIVFQKYSTRYQAHRAARMLPA